MLEIFAGRTFCCFLIFTSQMKNWIFAKNWFSLNSKAKLRKSKNVFVSIWVIRKNISSQKFLTLKFSIVIKLFWLNVLEHFCFFPTNDFNVKESCLNHIILHCDAAELLDKKYSADNSWTYSALTFARLLLPSVQA